MTFIVLQAFTCVVCEGSQQGHLQARQVELGQLDLFL